MTAIVLTGDLDPDDLSACLLRDHGDHGLRSPLRERLHPTADLAHVSTRLPRAPGVAVVPPDLHDVEKAAGGRETILKLVEAWLQRPAADPRLFSEANRTVSVRSQLLLTLGHAGVPAGAGAVRAAQSAARSAIDSPRASATRGIVRGRHLSIA